MAKKKKTAPVAVNPYEMPEKNKSEGDVGNVVRWIQFQLGIKISGEFDKATVEAVRSFQKAHALKMTGVVDKLTRVVLADVK